jgi:hypothetical protein
VIHYNPVDFCPAWCADTHAVELSCGGQHVHTGTEHVSAPVLDFQVRLPGAAYVDSDMEIVLTRMAWTEHPKSATPEGFEGFRLWATQGGEIGATMTRDDLRRLARDLLRIADAS